MSFGLDSSGFNLKTLTDVITALRTKQQTLFGAAFAAQLDTSVVGQLNGVFANEIADLWLLAQSVYRSRFPSQATGISLDNLAEETGALRLPATKSTVTITVSGTNGTVVPVGFVVRVPTTGARFVSIETDTISGGTVSIDMASEDYGPILAPAGELTEIVTPVGGVTSVTNSLDAALGSNVETDSAFRLRRAGLLRAQGEATIAAIQSDILSLTGVSEVTIFNNPTDATVDSIPAHSFEAVVLGGADQDIWDEILNSTPAGIQSYGAEVGSSNDIFGNAQVVEFTRPTEVLMYADVIVTTNDDYPIDGDDQIKQAIVDYWEGFESRLGKDVINNAFYGSLYAIPGVVEVTSLKIDDISPTTTTTTTTIAARSIAIFDTSRITVA